MQEFYDWRAIPQARSRPKGVVRHAVLHSASGTRQWRQAHDEAGVGIHRARRSSAHDARRAAHQGRQSRRRRVTRSPTCSRRTTARACRSTCCARAARWAAGSAATAWSATSPPASRTTRAVETYRFLDRDTRDVYEGFAAGANRYIELHPEEFPAGFAPHFTGYDVLAHDVSMATRRAGGALSRAQRSQLPRSRPRRSRDTQPRGGRRTARRVGRSAGRRLERVGVRAEPHEVEARDPAAQSAPRVERRLLRSARHRARRARLLRRLPHRRTVRRDRRLQSRPRLGDDEQRSAALADLRARRRSRARRSLSARRRVACRSSARSSRVEYRDGAGLSSETRERGARRSAR